jgi:hypothetical protein
MTGSPRLATRPHLNSILGRLWRAHVERRLARERGTSQAPADEKIRSLSKEALLQGLTPIELKIKLEEMAEQTSEMFGTTTKNGATMKKRTSKRAGVRPNMDRRDLMGMIKAFPEDAKLDEERMTITFMLDQDEGEPLDCVMPFRFGVCGTCGGKGKHVNPSIDSEGITGSEMEELGPEFLEDYMGGVYDVPCAECAGQRVVPVIDEARADKKCLDAFHEWQEEQWRYARESDAERRSGA